MPSLVHFFLLTSQINPHIVGRMIGIDYGKKYVGLATTVPGTSICTGLCVQSTHSVVNFLRKYVKKEKVDNFVLGLPKGLDSQDTDATSFILDFSKQLEKNFPDIHIAYVDEQFTTKIARQSMHLAQLPKKKRENKSLLNQTAAVLILQNYIAQFL